MSIQSSDAEERVRAVAQVKQLIADDLLLLDEVRQRLTVDDLQILRQKDTPDLEVPLPTYQRLNGLIEFALGRRSCIPLVGTEVVDRQPVVVGEHGTVAHEVSRIQLLLVEFSPVDVLNIRQLLDRSRDTVFEITSIACVEEAGEMLDQSQFDVGMLDITSNASAGVTILASEGMVSADIPVIAVIGGSDEPQLLHLGARDYLIKDQITSPLLVRTLRTAVEHDHLVKELHHARQREHFHATRDSMTGLPNRFYFQEQLAGTITHAARFGTEVSVCFLDLDRFKQINDTLGHDVGDSLIITMADRLSSIIRSCDIVARVGGDEFLLMIQSTDSNYEPAAVGRNVLQALSRPFAVDGQEFSFTGSLGIAVYPTDGEDPTDLVRKADAAMYQAKARGRNNFQLYNKSLSAAVDRKIALEGRLRIAIERNNLAVHYQPRIDTTSGLIVAAEALARWSDPEMGEISPSEFIPIAEDSGVITSIGEWVLNEACAQFREWQKVGITDLRLSVNFSARQIHHDSVREVIVGALMRSGLDPSLLEIELTESALIEDQDRVGKVLLELSELGVGFSLDDFGTGYSSLNYLRRFPVSTIKIDRSFVAGVLSNADDAAISEAIISIAEKLRLRVVAEGVEELDQCRFLRSHGCIEMQGYYFSEPLKADDLLDLIRSGILKPALLDR